MPSPAYFDQRRPSYVHQQHLSPYGPPMSPYHHEHAVAPTYSGPHHNQPYPVEYSQPPYPYSGMPAAPPRYEMQNERYMQEMEHQERLYQQGQLPQAPQHFHQQPPQVRHAVLHGNGYIEEEMPPLSSTTTAPGSASLDSAPSTPTSAHETLASAPRGSFDDSSVGLGIAMPFQPYPFKEHAESQHSSGPSLLDSPRSSLMMSHEDLDQHDAVSSKLAALRESQLLPAAPITDSKDGILSMSEDHQLFP